MRSGPLASAWRKFDRGEVHRKTLEAELTRIEKDHADNIPVEVDVQWHGHTIRGAVLFDRGSAVVSLGSPFPTLREDFGLVLGDAVGNYRAALDHLTWALVRRFGVRLSAKQARAVQFPMHNSARDFEREKMRRTPGVPDNPHRAVLKRYQPYRRGDGPSGIRWLRTLADADKHRVVSVAVLVRQTSETTYSVSDGVWITGSITNLVRRGLPLEPGTPIAKFTMAADPQVRRREVKVKGEMTLRPTIRKSVDAIGAANLTGAVVKELLTTFDPLI